MKTIFTISSHHDPYVPSMFETQPNTPAHREAIAHLLRRTAFGPRPGRVDAMAHRPLADVVDETLADIGDRAVGLDLVEPSEDAEDEVIAWWFDRINDPRTGLHERMVWYWHGHFTTAIDNVGAVLMWEQHRLVRKHALGNFRTLTKAMLEDGAMLVYLDGDGSQGEQPNENLARELMELFTLGVGNYTEDDVKAAARALSGYWVDWDTAEVTFEPAEHYDRPIQFLGSRSRFSAADIADALCDQTACARHVARRLHRHLVGVDPDDNHLDRLAAVFRGADLEILPLVEAIVRGDSFWANHRSRPRQPVEWLIAATAALGADNIEFDPWELEVSGQVPFNPPNVAGWPEGDRWVGGSQVLGRISHVLQLSREEIIDTNIEPTVDAVLERCSIWDISDATRAALDGAARDQPEYAQRLELLFALTLASPEFALA